MITGRISLQTFVRLAELFAVSAQAAAGGRIRRFAMPAPDAILLLVDLPDPLCVIETTLALQGHGIQRRELAVCERCREPVEPFQKTHLLWPDGGAGVCPKCRALAYGLGALFGFDHGIGEWT